MYWKYQSNFEPKCGIGQRVGVAEYSLVSWKVHANEWGFISDSWKDVLTSPTEQKAFDVWESFLKNYTNRELSNESDRLPAIAAAAELFSARLNCHYLAGVWRKSLLRDLTWRVARPGPKADRYRGPSWSWASVNGPILFQKGTNWPNYTVRILDCSTTLGSATSKWGAVTGGKLVIEGYLWEVSLSQDRKSIIHHGGLERSEGVYWDNDSGQTSSDHSYSDVWLFVLGMSTPVNGPRGRQMIHDLNGLVLGKLSSEETSYRRFAYFRNQGADLLIEGLGTFPFYKKIVTII
jgi:hypothetical protein